ncbi:MFS transporter [Aliidiomarina minuta]|uniref:MFS transporter n=1 Tax=Aliidiomarina minuta TaxID=880057 RepID=A0A432W752_9GAMM|nr:MFS transporter [Aliidiomarina minuta]RUO25897.1 MFS transporter [Aliidiomarina minuta]
MLKQQLKAVSSLLSTMTLIGLCVGMTSTLLSLRATIEGFSTMTTGIIMSAYFIGFLFGTTRAPKDIRRVGYIRAFGGLAALASIAVLIQSIWVEPTVWFVARFLSGFAISAMFVIAESWLNTMADNRNRGTMLSVYLVLIYGGLIAGQLILGIADPATFVPFVIIAMLINLSLIPILIAISVEPTTHSPRKVPIRFLLKQAPLGIAAAFIIQACYAMFYGIGPMYAIYIGLSVPQVTIFMAAFIFGGLVLQAPVGLLSDRIDRRMVLAGVAAVGSIAALVLSQLDGTTPLLIFFFMAILGGCLLPVYSLAMAHTNDYLETDQMIGATGSIIKVGGIGAIIGAPSVAALMQFGAVEAFFFLIAGLTLTISLYAMYRTTQRAKAKEQSHSVLTNLAPAQLSEELLSSLVEDAGDDQDEDERPHVPVDDAPEIRPSTKPEQD